MRRIVAVASVLLIAVAGGYALYWHSAARTLAGGIARWVEEQRAAGYTVSLDEPEIGGFPFRLEARIGAPQMAAPPGGLPWRWRGPTLLLQAPPWAPLDFQAEAPGRHEIEWPDGGTARRYLVEVAAAKGSGRVGLDGRLAEASIALTGVSALEFDKEDAVLIRGVDASIVPGEAASHTEPSLGFLVALAGLTLPPDIDSPLGREVEKLEVEGAVMGPLSWNGDGGALEDTLARWRDDGGTLEVSRIIVRWGELELSGNGTFALDAALQPIGAMTATAVGHDAVIDALVAGGAVTARDGSLAKVVLSVLAQPSPVDGRPELTVPLQLQDGHLWAGPARLAPLPRIEWP